MKHTLSLPIPPSVNGLYAGKARRYKSPAYKSWLKECVVIPVKTFTNNVHITYAFYPKNGTFGDTQNRLKALTDFLVTAGILQDDNHKILRSEHLYFAGYDPENPRVEVTIEGVA